MQQLAPLILPILGFDAYFDLDKHIKLGVNAGYAPLGHQTTKMFTEDTQDLLDYTGKASGLQYAANLIYASGKHFSSTLSFNQNILKSRDQDVATKLQLCSR